MAEANLSTVYEIRPDVNYRIEKKHVIIVKEQNHWFQRFLRKIFFKIPKQSEMKLDAYVSFIFQLIDGKLTVGELGEKLSIQYEEAGDKLYERLFLFLNHLENNENWIRKIEN